MSLKLPGNIFQNKSSDQIIAQFDNIISLLDSTDAVTVNLISSFIQNNWKSPKNLNFVNKCVSQFNLFDAPLNFQNSPAENGDQAKNPRVDLKSSIKNELSEILPYLSSKLNNENQFSDQFCHILEILKFNSQKFEDYFDVASVLENIFVEWSAINFGRVLNFVGGEFLKFGDSGRVFGDVFPKIGKKCRFLSFVSKKRLFFGIYSTRQKIRPIFQCT